MGGYFEISSHLILRTSAVPLDPLKRNVVIRLSEYVEELPPVGSRQVQRAGSIHSMIPGWEN